MRKDNIESIYPLSPLQQGMLFHAAYEERSNAYEESLSFTLHGSLDSKALREAWHKVVERHPALRTFILWKEVDAPLQVVRRTVELPWQELDWSHLSKAEQEERLSLLLKEQSEEGFDLSRAPLMNLTLIRLSRECHYFHWDYHHMILDGWSVTIVLKEIFTIYHSLRENHEVQLADPQPYQTYIGWLGRQDLTTAETFWKEKLEGFTPSTLLSTEGNSPVKSWGIPEHRYQELCLSMELSSALRSLAREQKLTLNTLFQGAWALLLSRYSGESDVLFGTAVSGRSVPVEGADTVVGLLIGSLPVRVQLPSRVPLLDWLGTLQADQVQARQFEYSSVQNIQAWVGIDRSKGQTLFDTILSFNNYAIGQVLEEQAGELEITDVKHREGSHFPLTLLIDPGEEFRIRIKFDSVRFDEALIRRICGHLQHLLNEMAADPGRPLAEFTLLTAAEKQKLVVEFNDTGSGMSLENSVVQLFEEQVRSTPEANALRFQGQTINYHQLNRQANQLAHYLKKQGVGPGKVVALCLDRSPHVIVAILATLKSGGGYLPLDASLPASRQSLMLEETEAPIILTNRRLEERLPEVKGKVIRLDADWAEIALEPDNNPAPAAGPEDTAYIIYTSGSTGRPKGAIVRHRNLMNYITWARDFYLQGEVLDFPLFSSLSFDLTVTSMYVPLVSGGSIVIYGESETPNLEVLDVVRDDQVDIIKLTPAHLNLLQSANVSSPRLRKMIVGGEDFKRSLAQGIHDLFGGRIEIYNEYGPTETTVGCMIHRFDPAEDADASVPIGQPIQDTQIYILDRQLLPVPPGVIGEMCIGGASVARGYLQQPELTESRFVGDPFHPGGTLYRTGDLARWTPEGRMQFLGRSDYQVKIKGYRIELGEIENNLLDHPEIESAVVTAFQPAVRSADAIKRWCVQCGLPDNYPEAEFDSTGVCRTCREFSELKARFRDYFKTPADLQKIADRAKETKAGEYDCIVLYSGGKDSTYMLHQLVREYGMRPLVFNLDNGYISEEAKENIRRTTDHLGVDLLFGQTPHMKDIFADSLKRHSNVCDGCFKVIYTLSISLARQKGIKYIFTGLSRGQLFETRLSDMFQARIFNTEEIDRTVLAARKAYHRVDDAVHQLMDVQVFENDTLFDEVQLVDFYRYTDVSLSEMYRYLDQNAPWVRPSDTGRSTNCLINDVGIYIHKKERGFHNYALPYSWDVRVGHKTTAETIHELNDEIDESKVRRILNEIGYDEHEKVAQRVEKRLVAYYVSRKALSASELRQYLSAKLPEYMLPSDFIHLEEMPLTANGKIDRTSLPDPDTRRKTPVAGNAVPTTEQERQLAQVWRQVFRMPEVGINDNFFELGGDSIISIQIVTKAAQAGLHFTPRDIFEQQTIARLALVVETGRNQTAEQGLVTGPAPLTPVQRWFFEQNFNHPDHWNQSLWLHVPATLERNALQEALNHLPKQHDLLRARYHQSTEGVWQQTIPIDHPELAVEFYDLSGMKQGEQEALMQELAMAVEGSLNLEAGPLLKTALFALAPNLPMRLFVTCHHLVVDGISWQPLLADWETAYRQILQGETVRLPAKTTSFKEWSEKLVSYSQSPALDKELEYWQTIYPLDVTPSQLDEDRRQTAIQTVSCVLGARGTKALLSDVHEAYNTNVLDLLVAAWAQAYAEQFGVDVASLVLEGHGREPEIVTGVDLSNTVGWFTIHYPLYVPITESWDPRSQLIEVKERLRRVPNRGIGYGLLRYLRVERTIAAQPAPPVLFNYMGQFERALPASDLFSLAQPLQAGYSPENRRTHDLEVNAFVREGQLQLNVAFDGGRYALSSVQKVVDGFLHRLEDLIEHCLSPDAGAHTPSDFGLANLTDEQFGQLSDILSKLDGG